MELMWNVESEKWNEGVLRTIEFFCLHSALYTLHFVLSSVRTVVSPLVSCHGVTELAAVEVDADLLY